MPIACYALLSLNFRKDTYFGTAGQRAESHIDILFSQKIALVDENKISFAILSMLSKSPPQCQQLSDGQRQEATNYFS